MISLNVEGHFSRLGWKKNRTDFSLMLCHGEKLEAFRISCAGTRLVYGGRNIDGECAAEDGDMAGTTGMGKPLYMIQAVTGDENKHIYYRIYSEKNGWSDFFHDGEKASFEEKGIISGLQFFLCDDESLNDAFSQAEDTRVWYQNQYDKLFLNDKNRVFLEMTQNYLHDSAEATEVFDGYVLPLKKLDLDSRNGIYVGGVTDSDFHFVAGLDRDNMRRMNLSCVDSYTVDEWEESSDTVIFGGVYHVFWGHFITECLSRLWWILEHPENTAPIVVLTFPQVDVAEQLYSIFKIMNISLDRVRFITKATKFSKIIIPEQSLRIHQCFTSKFLVPYDVMRNNVTKGSYEKIYLTRTGLKYSDSVNEEFLENFYAKRGYKVISPEKYSLRVQISILYGAHEVVCTEGTLSHMLLFCEKGTKVTIFRRCPDTLLKPQYMINRARDLDVTYVDATYNLLPVRHSGGVFLYGPTKYFREYLQKSGISFTEDELLFRAEDYCGRYVKLWLDHYRKLKNFNSIRSNNMLDLINQLSDAFGYEELSQDTFITRQNELEKELSKVSSELEETNKSNKKLTQTNLDLKELLENNEREGQEILAVNESLKEENERLQIELEMVQKNYENVINSKTWRYTQALRNLMWKIKRNEKGDTQ